MNYIKINNRNYIEAMTTIKDCYMNGGGFGIQYSSDVYPEVRELVQDFINTMQEMDSMRAGVKHVYH